MSDQRVGPDEVRHVASLARVDIDEEEVESFATQMDEVLEYFESLDAVPDVDRDTELTNVMRPDEVRDSLDPDEALANAPDSEDGYFKGPNVS